MKLADIKASVSEMRDVGELAGVLNQWGEVGRYTNTNENYILGVGKILERVELGNVNETLLDALCSTDVMTMKEFPELFVGFQSSVKSLIMLAFARGPQAAVFSYEDDPEPNWGNYEDRLLDLFLGETVENSDVFYNMMFAARDGYPGVGKFLIKHFTTAIGINTTSETYYNHKTTGRETLSSVNVAVLDNIESITWREEVVLLLRFTAPQIYKLWNGDKLSDELFYKFISRINDGEVALSDDTKIIKAMAPNEAEFRRLMGEERAIAATEYITERTRVVEAYVRELGQKIVEYGYAMGGVNGDMLPLPLRYKIVTMTIDTLDHLWKYKLKKFPYDNDEEAEAGIKDALSYAFRKNNDESSKNKRVRCGTDARSIDDERKVVALTRDIKRILEDVFN